MSNLHIWFMKSKSDGDFVVVLCPLYYMYTCLAKLLMCDKAEKWGNYYDVKYSYICKLVSTNLFRVLANCILSSTVLYLFVRILSFMFQTIFCTLVFL